MPTDDSTARKPLISRDTVVPLGIVVAVIAIAASSAWSVAASLTANDVNSQNRFERIEQGVSDLKESIEALDHDQFTRAEMGMWVEVLTARNPELNIPPIKNE